MGNNRIHQVFPEFIANLDTVNLENNCLTTIPEDFASENLVEINLNNNKLVVLNANCFVKEKCPRLKVLRLKNNQLTVTEFTEGLLKNSNVSTLEFEGNRFNEKALKELDGYDELCQRFTDMMMKKD